MAKFNPKELTEINAIIAAIEKEGKTYTEIGGRDKAILQVLLKTNGIDKSPKYFACRREFSESIVLHFTKNKTLTKSRFSMTAQANIYLL